MYLSYFTSNVVKPFEKVYIDSNKALLLDSPYRILVTDNSSLSSYSSEFYSNHKNEFSKIGLSNDSNLKVYFLYSKETADERIRDTWKISFARDEGTTLFYTKFGKQYVIEAEAQEPGVNCHMVKENWTVGRVWIWFQGHLTEAAYDFFRSIIMSGIDIYWDKAFFNNFDRYTRRKAEKLKLSRQGDTIIEGASMKTSLSSFLKLFALLLVFDIFVFFTELVLLFSSRMHNWLNRLKLNFWYWKNFAFKKLH
jgi:hypothetical protein